MKRQALKHNVIDRDKIVVPPNWDSWGKIRVLRDGFDVEAVSNGWSDDLKSADGPTGAAPSSGSAIVLYESWIRDPSTDALHLSGRDADPSKLEVASQDTQQFLEDQLRVLEAFRTKANESKTDAKTRALRRPDDGFASPRDEIAVSDHIGPVQFNMGGIQVDADDMLQRIKVRAPVQYTL
jgi:dynein light intermediate chain 1, cytosolic